MNNTDFNILQFSSKDNFFKNISKEHNSILKKYFSTKIRGNFLLNIKESVMKDLGSQRFPEYFNFQWSTEKAITGIGDDTAEFDICRMIVGTHRAHSVFLTDEERRANEKDDNYKKRIISEVLEKIKLRKYGSTFFRKKPLFFGEEFLYYPLPHDLFILSVKTELMLKTSEKLYFASLYSEIIRKSLSALVLLEDNLLNNAYPLCRGAIEIYAKLLLIKNNINVYDRYEQFSEYEIQRECSSNEYPQEFNKLFDKRKNKKPNRKADYMHFGWVDFINGYHNIIAKTPYTVYGIFKYLKTIEKDRIPELENLEHLYKICHPSTHGSIFVTKYPILNYFEISIILYYILRNTYIMLCDQTKEKHIIDGIDIIKTTDSDFDELYKKYQERSTEKFEAYYNTKTK